MQEYYQALLFHTLNVIRLKPGDRINPYKELDRRHPVLAAALICARLEDWPDREVSWPHTQSRRHQFPQ